MTEYRGGAHTVYEIHLHVVWTTKYRKQVLVGEVATRVRDLIREICGGHDVKIMKGHVSKDHVHLLVSIPPQVTISRLLLLEARLVRKSPRLGLRQQGRSDLQGVVVFYHIVHNLDIRREQAGVFPVRDELKSWRTMALDAPF